jgi:mRNA deadenylase 3'-5' endonuclease subunit Ccr4
MTSSGKIQISLGSFNVMSHVHLNRFSNLKESSADTRARYIDAISIILRTVSDYNLNIVCLSEVTDEFYKLFENTMDESISEGLVTIFYDRNSLMTIFFGITPHRVNDLYQDKQRDRIQVFNVTLDNSQFTIVNIHGYGDPKIREVYFFNTLKYLNELSEAKLIKNKCIVVGDFNTESDVVSHVLNDATKNKQTKLKLLKYYNPTSYHKYILGDDKVFYVKHPSLRYTRVDHLLYTPQTVKMSQYLSFPHNFTESERPYKIVNKKQVLGDWPSDHTFDIYTAEI